MKRKILVKIHNMKFHENPPGGNRTVPCGQVEGRTDSTSLNVAFRNCFARTPKNLQDNNEEWISKKLKREEVRFMRNFLNLDGRTTLWLKADL